MRNSATWKNKKMQKRISEGETCKARTYYKRQHRDNRKLRYVGKGETMGDDETCEHGKMKKEETYKRRNEETKNIRKEGTQNKTQAYTDAHR